MFGELENYYFRQPELIRESLLAMREILLGMDRQISHRQRFKIPFFYYREWRLAFLWVKDKKIMLGILTDLRSIPQNDRKSRRDEMDFIILDPNEDFPIKEISEKINDRIMYYNNLEFEPK